MSAVKHQSLERVYQNQRYQSNVSRTTHDLRREPRSTDIAHSVVYVGSHDGSLYALNGSTGELICRYQIDASVVSSPTVSDGVGYVGTWDGYVYAIGAHFTD